MKAVSVSDDDDRERPDDPRSRANRFVQFAAEQEADNIERASCWRGWEPGDREYVKRLRTIANTMSNLIWKRSRRDASKT